jgi:sugar transferase EpsL
VNRAAFHRALDKEPMSYGDSRLKRTLDLAVAGLWTILFSPLMGLVALLIWLSMGQPIFFRQTRPGWHGKPFEIIKFRTMTAARDDQGLLLPNHERLTPLGRLLRNLSLDELPELFNVLQGNMSVVGPRPLLMQYLDRYTPEQRRRHDVKPGITGWAQVNGRNDLTWEDKFSLDLWYVAHQSFWLDLKIMALTVVEVLRRKGINKAGYVGMEEFLGSRS